jgi:hypothetical protein
MSAYDRPGDKDALFIVAFNASVGGVEYGTNQTGSTA